MTNKFQTTDRGTAADASTGSNPIRDAASSPDMSSNPERDAAASADLSDNSNRDAAAVKGAGSASKQDAAARTAGVRPIRAVLFDFDGTLSTLRAGWEQVMAPFFKETIMGEATLSSGQERALEQEIEAYIDQSAGIQTIYQMQWLKEQAASHPWQTQRQTQNEWDYKAEYNRRLLAQVNERITGLRAGRYRPSDFLIAGSEALLERLHAAGVAMYIASGTDHPDVVNEAETLGVAKYFRSIAGAPVGRADCSKEKVIRELLAQKELQGGGLAVIGDGKVEIRLARESGALALGVASDEDRREGINEIKRKRLEAAGADRIAGDFRELTVWLEWLGLCAPAAN